MRTPVLTRDDVQQASVDDIGLVKLDGDRALATVEALDAALNLMWRLVFAIDGDTGDAPTTEAREFMERMDRR